MFSRASVFYALLFVSGRQLLSQTEACNVLLSGNDCSQPKKVPVCLNEVFKYPLVLNKEFLPNSSQVPLLRSYGIKTPRFREMLPEHDLLGPKTPNSKNRVLTCALVSNSGSLLQSGYGKQIDDHDIVMRLNNAPTKSYESDVGSRTDLRYTNGYFEGFRAKQGKEAVVAGKWCAHEQPLYCQNELPRILSKKAFPLNPYFLRHVRAGFSASHHNPSAGFVAMVMLLHICSKVDLYEFATLSPSVDTQTYSMKHWYFAKRKKNHNEVSKKLQNRSWQDRQPWRYIPVRSSPPPRQEPGKPTTLHNPFSQQGTAPLDASNPNFVSQRVASPAPQGHLVSTDSAFRAPAQDNPLTQRGLWMGPIDSSAARGSFSNDPTARVDASASQDPVGFHGLRWPGRRRLSNVQKLSQSTTMYLEKLCMREVYQAGLINVFETEEKPEVKNQAIPASDGPDSAARLWLPSQPRSPPSSSRRSSGWSNSWLDSLFQASIPPL